MTDLRLEIDDLLHFIRSGPTTVGALSDWLGVETLELDRVLSNTAHRLTQHERAILLPHPGVFYGYHRTALLRTPEPSSRVVASVDATVLLGNLPKDTAHEIIYERRTLGSVLLEIDARREFLSASRGGRSDAAGNPIALRTSFVFTWRDEPIALVREDIYEDIIMRKA